jgi:hypothetical protein
MQATLDPADLATLDAVLSQRRSLDGDVYSSERDLEGRHGRVMKYDLNEAPH